jgi:uncharacterized DUF497 family protein
LLLALTFEWDESKGQENLIKHGVGFEEAKSVFNDPLAITIRDEVIRLISCRVATPRERLNYEQG